MEVDIAMEIVAEVYKGGRVTIPMPIRQSLNIQDGEQITFKQDGTSLKIITAQEQLKYARELIRQHCSGEEFSVDAFLQERREESEALGFSNGQQSPTL